MNEDILKGKWKSLKGDAKIWWGQTTGDSVTELDGSKDKIVGWFQKHKGMAREDAENELKQFSKAKETLESRSEELNKKIKHRFEKLSDSDISEINGNLDAWADKIKSRYDKSQEEANKQIKDFMNKLND